MSSAPPPERRPGAGTTTGATSSERPLRVVLIEFLPSGGMYQFSFQFADALARQGHAVTLLTGPGPEIGSQTANLEILEELPTWHPNAAGVAAGTWRTTVRRAWRALLLVESWRRVLVYLRRTRPDIVQFGELRYALDSAAFLAVARFGRSGLVVDVAHNPLPYDVTSKTHAVEKGGRLTTALLGRAYRACGLVLVLGDGPRSELLQHFPGVRRTAVCGHGDYSSVIASTDVPAPSTAGPRALFFGAWTRYKDLPLLLDAFALVREQLPEARLTLAGPVMPDVDLDELRARADTVGHVDLDPGYVAMEDVPGLFARHRVVMFTYATVNISGSVHMAYTFGRPVVATDVGAMSDAVEDGVTGLLAPPTAPAVARAMLAVLGDPDLADRLGSAAAAKSAGGRSWSDVADRAVEAYRTATA